MNFSGKTKFQLLVHVIFFAHVICLTKALHKHNTIASKQKNTNAKRSMLNTDKGVHHEFPLKRKREYLSMENFAAAAADAFRAFVDDYTRETGHTTVQFSDRVVFDQNEELGSIQDQVVWKSDGGDIDTFMSTNPSENGLSCVLDDAKTIARLRFRRIANKREITMMKGHFLELYGDNAKFNCLPGLGNMSVSPAPWPSKEH